MDFFGIWALEQPQPLSCYGLVGAGRGGVIRALGEPSSFLNLPYGHGEGSEFLICNWS